eukprot:8939554-Alexandrium_andersonii.AAC.1
MTAICQLFLVPATSSCPTCTWPWTTCSACTTCLCSCTPVLHARYAPDHVRLAHARMRCLAAAQGPPRSGRRARGGA